MPRPNHATVGEPSVLTLIVLGLLAVRTLGVKRSTFVIDADGKVKRVMHDVKPATHADDVLAALAG